MTFVLMLFILVLHRRSLRARDTQAAGAVTLASRRRRGALLYMLVMSLRLYATFIASRIRNRVASGFSRAALAHPFIAPISYLLRGGSDADFIACFAFNQQSFFRLAQVCEQVDTLHGHPNRYALDGNGRCVGYRSRGASCHWVV
jgi:hypothetical protein